MLSELAAIERAYHALEPLHAAGRKRAMRWLRDALENAPSPESVPAPAGTEATETGEVVAAPVTETPAAAVPAVEVPAEQPVAEPAAVPEPTEQAAAEPEAPAAVTEEPATAAAAEPAAAEQAAPEAEAKPDVTVSPAPAPAKKATPRRSRSRAAGGASREGTRQTAESRRGGASSGSTGRKRAAAAKSTEDRPYRRMPDVAEVMSAYRQVGSITGLAEHFKVPRHTVQGWARRLRDLGQPIGRTGER